jgi:hypothetical protein
MRKTLVSVILTIFVGILSAQDVQEEATKFQQFASKTGVIIKFVDYHLPDLSLMYGAAETKIRKFISGGEIGFFYQISYKGKYDTKTASIAYEDLQEILKAIGELSSEFTEDTASNPDYMENKFVTEDGFQVGYYVTGTRSAWYLVLEKYGSDNTVFIRDVATITDAFTEAAEMIMQLSGQ